MSSETPNLQQLYEAERFRAKVLEKRNARMKADFEHEIARLVADLRQVQEKLDYQEAGSEIKDEQLQAKDAAIEELQTALDDAKRSGGSGDDKKVGELQATIKDFDRRLDEALRGDWDNVIPLLEERLTKRLKNASLKISYYKEKLSKANAELSNANTEIMSLKEEVKMLRSEQDPLLAEDGSSIPATRAKPKSPTEVELLRLKDRQTLHRLR